MYKIYLHIYIYIYMGVLFLHPFHTLQINVYYNITTLNRWNVSMKSFSVV